MPYRKVHQGTGFVEFFKTPEEKRLDALESENSQLKNELNEIKKLLKGTDLPSLNGSKEGT